MPVVIEWKDLNFKGFKFRVSSAGKIKFNNKPVKPYLSDTGYLTVIIVSSERRVSAYVHRLVAIAFLGTPSGNRQFVNHLNGIKTDNSIDNLEWCSKSENGKHAYRTGLNEQGREAARQTGLNNRTFTDNQLKEVLSYESSGLSKCEISRRTSLSRHIVRRILQRRYS